MAAGTHREDSKPTIGPEKRKYMWLMQAGLSCIFAWPVAIMLAAMYGLESMVPIMSVLMVMVGVVILAIGYTGWQELKERGLKGSENKIGDTKTEVLCSKEKTVLP